MDRDIRTSPSFIEASELYTRVRRPGKDEVSDAVDLQASPDGLVAIFTGIIAAALPGGLGSRIQRIDLATGVVTQVAALDGQQRHARFAPDGEQIAFLSDAHESGDFQLYLASAQHGALEAAPKAPGWVEYCHWSPDGTRVLLGVAAHGADLTTAQGALSTSRDDNTVPDWVPTLDTTELEWRSRRVFLYHLGTKTLEPIGLSGTIWEAGWCGENAIVVLRSEGGSESDWYNARLEEIGLEDLRVRRSFRHASQLGGPVAAPGGGAVAVIAGLASDRGAVAGDIFVSSLAGTDFVPIGTNGIDVTHAEWRSDSQLLIAGYRNLTTVVALCDVDRGTVEDIWASDMVSAGPGFIHVSGIGSQGDCALVGEGFTTAPEIALIKRRKYCTVRSLVPGFSEIANVVGRVERHRWQGVDGEAIDGWLLRPPSEGPYPLIVHLHGGPVSLWRSIWLCRGRHSLWTLMLLARGFAIFLPNPRGSVSKGQAFAAAVMGDPGGGDASDVLAGIDHLVAAGLADSNRLGVTGGSYGGFLTAWLITQDTRFAAAIAISPHINQVSEMLLSNIPHFIAALFGGDFDRLDSHLHTRSPHLHAARCKTPTLTICGALDRCTPPTEAAQFHAALRLGGCRSALLTYPGEGHSVAKPYGVIDLAARITDWFSTHLQIREDQNA